MVFICCRSSSVEVQATMLSVYLLYFEVVQIYMYSAVEETNLCAVKMKRE